MKHYISIILLLCLSLAQAQDKIKQPPRTRLVDIAKSYLDQSNLKYNPVEAFNLYKYAAENGDRKAMNALAILYSDGIGTTMDQDMAFKWFKKATESGYIQAWYNLGSMHKKGKGTSQDFKLAYECFSRGAEQRVSYCIYAKGYMLFKGLGCTQDYEQAVALFKSNVGRGSTSSMYMLGICYRNGYGIARNIDSARYWLKLSAGGGYQFAKDELNEPEPENIRTAVSRSVTSEKNKNDYFKVQKHHLPQNKVAGSYSGYIIKYDWSGKHIIGRSQLRLDLKQNDGTLTGQWVDETGVSVALHARLTDTSLIFANTAFSSADHYSAGVPVTFEFKNASLQLIEDGSSVHLAGSLQLWSKERLEPEKPIYVSLSRNKEDSGPFNELADTIVTNFSAYPNPFQKNLNVEFTLKEANKVSISLIDVNQSRVVYSLPDERLQPGKYSRRLSADLPYGYYVLRLTYGNKVKTAIILSN